MSDFDTYECDTCGGEFKAYPDAKAAKTGFCSPRCQTT